MSNKNRSLENLMDTSVDNASDHGSCQWLSPSNIALVKYWGKKHEQIPCNPSISFTLQNAHTNTRLEWGRSKGTPGKHVNFTFHFHKKNNEAFSNRLQKYLDRLADEIPVLKNYHLTISSENTFPHSSGIASSASAMSALAACMVDLEHQVTDQLENKKMITKEFCDRTSLLSRLGSGSACRSIHPRAALWGKCRVPGSTNDYAIGLESILHPVFHQYKDAILLVDQGEKKVSSSAGHQLMDLNPYAQIRYAEALENTETLLSILKSGDLDDFNTLVEKEAMTLHALMMVSSPGYILMHPNTLRILDKVKAYRHDTGIPICFTLDAGPNVHLLYPHQYTESVHEFIRAELLPWCAENSWIDDEVGMGFQKIK